MSMLFSCCCGKPSGSVRVLTDVFGSSGETAAIRTGTSGTFGVNCDWAITAIPDDLTLTYTTEIDVTTHRNAIGWGFARGVFGTYRTMRPDYILQPTKLKSLGLVTGVNHQKLNTSLFVYQSAGTLRPKTYQLFLDQVAVTGIVNVDQSAVWPNNVMPLTFQPPDEYSQLRIDVVCYFDDYPNVDASSRIVIPWSLAGIVPGIRAEYELRRAPFQQSVDILSPPEDSEVLGKVFADTTETSHFNPPRWLPVGSSGLPLQSPWYQRPSGTDSAIPDVVTPTFGLWEGGQFEFFNAIEPLVAIDEPPFTNGLPGSGDVRVVLPNGPREKLTGFV